MADIVKLMPRRKRIVMPRRKRIALIAHDNCKTEMLEWARFNRGALATHELHATGATGALLAYELGLMISRFCQRPARR
jgi:methylglyoxal synthase